MSGTKSISRARKIVIKAYSVVISAEGEEDVVIEDPNGIRVVLEHAEDITIDPAPERGTL